MIGNKQLEKIVCIACNETFAEHSKRQLIRCIFRIQSTMVTDEMERIKAKPINANEEKAKQDNEDDGKSWQQRAYEVQG